MKNSSAIKKGMSMDLILDVAVQAIIVGRLGFSLVELELKGLAAACANVTPVCIGPISIFRLLNFR